MGIDKSVGWVKGGAKPGQLESASVEEKPETLTVLANPRDNEDFFFFLLFFLISSSSPPDSQPTSSVLSTVAAVQRQTVSDKPKPGLRKIEPTEVCF